MNKMPKGMPPKKMPMMEPDADDGGGSPKSRSPKKLPPWLLKKGK